MTDKNASRQRQFMMAVVEIGFILFLFYANLLMGEYTRSNPAHRALLPALRDVVTLPNFVIGVVAACIGHGVFEYLRRRL